MRRTRAIVVFRSTWQRRSPRTHKKQLAKTKDCEGKTVERKKPNTDRDQLSTMKSRLWVVIDATRAHTQTHTDAKAHIYSNDPWLFSHKYVSILLCDVTCGYLYLITLSHGMIFKIETKSYGCAGANYSFARYPAINCGSGRQTSRIYCAGDRWQQLTVKSRNGGGDLYGSAGIRCREHMYTLA